MAFIKFYIPTVWKNKQKPKINADNLNKMEGALQELDSRTVDLSNEFEVHKDEMEVELDGIKTSIPSITNNLLATIAGTALDAVQGKALNDALTAFIEQINRDYYGTKGSAPVFDLMPGGTTGTVLSRLGPCYVSTHEDVQTYHAPATGYALAFGSSVDRYGIIFIGRSNKKMWFRSESTEWIGIPTVEEIAALEARIATLES